MKILLDKYPKGTYKGQITDGKFIDGYLYSNLRILAKKIVKDMTFMGIIYSSTLEVGTGKSVLATQIGEAWSEIMKKEHNLDIPFTSNNIVWRPKELIERSFQVPRYSYLLLDEWEDATYWSELGMTLRQFFRKCRQLNLFIMVIIPNFFQMNIGYAISRSAFAIDVRFGKDFERGFFSFYSFDAKRQLYIKGKKEHNYRVARPDFNGRFVNGYGIPEKEYREAKLRDLEMYDKEEPKQKTELEIKKELSKIMYSNLDKLTYKDLAMAFGVGKRTICNWLNSKKDTENDTPEIGKGMEEYYSKNLKDKEIFWNEEEIEEEYKKNE